MKADNIKPLLFKLISYSIFPSFERGKLKFQKSTTCIFWPQKFSFKLPIGLKTDFKILRIMKNLQNITPWLKLSKSPPKMYIIMYFSE